MSTAPIRLEDYSIVDFSISPIEIILPEAVNYEDLEASFQSTITRLERNPENPDQWRIFLRVETTTPAKQLVPYQLRATIRGFFRTVPGFPEENVEKLVRVTGTSIMYSALREFLLMVTSRCIHGPVMLPTISFLEQSKEQAQEQPPIGPKVKPTKPAKAKPRRASVNKPK